MEATPCLYIPDETKDDPLCAACGRPAGEHVPQSPRLRPMNVEELQLRHLLAALDLVRGGGDGA